MARNANEGRPEINLLLKDIGEELLADPGDHLKKVIAFKERVFAEKKLLAGTFSDIQDFEGEVPQVHPGDSSSALATRTRNLGQRRSRHL
ncbi:MAG: hypothetical protein IPI84_13850 [Holophagaceae bacterium]|nr:hypothetical protein [Holophagaceae bacterium]